MLNGIKRGEIARPCSNDWDAMSRDGAIRFCADCQKHVHDITGLSDEAAAAYIGKCVRREPPATRMSPRRRFLLWASAIAAAIPAFGQSTPALRLVVVDATGERIPKALVRIKPVSSNEKTLELRADEFGAVEQAVLAAGEYAVSVEVSGFRTFRETIRVDEGKRIHREVELQVATIGEYVEIEFAPAKLPVSLEGRPAELPPLRVRNLDLLMRRPKK